MFLKKLKERNNNLIETSIQLHQEGEILPDTYVIDIDMVSENTKKLAQTAKENDIELYFMLKQLGRNPYLAKKIIESGIEKAVVVDFKEARVMMDNNIPIGNVGHLVQVPETMLEAVLSYNVEYITVFSLEKLYSINKISKKLNKKQNILLRVVDDEDYQYPGQYSGFQLDELKASIKEIKELENINISGLTSFPVFLCSDEEGKVSPTSNLETMKKARAILEENGIDIDVMNTPSCTSVTTIPEINYYGGTQGEPGHALTGTTPMHAKKDLPEKPAYLYVSEVSHNYKGNAYLYGGGYYRRGHLENVLFDNNGKQTISKILPFADENIDYFLQSDTEQSAGTTAIMAFRTQIFTTRSEVALVEGISKNEPKLVGIYDSQGKYLRG